MATTQRPDALPGGLDLVLGFAVAFAAFIAAFQISDGVALAVGIVFIPGAFLLAMLSAHLRR